jgi:hypothetical protein
MSHYSLGPARTLQRLMHYDLTPVTQCCSLLEKATKAQARGNPLCTIPPSPRLISLLIFFVAVIRGSEFYVLVNFQMTAFSVKVIKEGCLPLPLVTTADNHRKLIMLDKLT